VSEQIFNDISAQLGYTVPFTSVHTGKYRTEDRLQIQIQIIYKRSKTQKEQTSQNTAKLN